MNKKLSKWQKSFILDGFDDPLRIAITGIGSGKSYSLSLWIILQCIKKPGIRGIMIAQNYRALTLVLIREIKNRCAEFGIKFNHNKGNNEIKFENGSVLYGFTAEAPDAILGLTEMDMLTMDEAAYCNEEIYNNAKDRLRGGKYKPMTRLISSPNSTDRVQNWFSAICKKYPECVIHATSLDNPFTSEEFKAELKERYVEGSPIYRQQVMGEILDMDIASQIIFRHEFPNKKQRDGEKFWMGYDASGLGSDTDQFVVIDKYGMVDVEQRTVSDTFEKADIVKKYFDKYSIKTAYADGTGGYSQGVIDVCNSKNIKITGINFAQKAFDEENYYNARCEMYLEAAKAIKAGFWVDDTVREEMLAQEVFINNKGMQQLLPKEDVKKILGHSPDRCDALVLAIYAMNHGNQQEDYEKSADEYLKLMGY